MLGCCLLYLGASEFARRRIRQGSSSGGGGTNSYFLSSSDTSSLWYITGPVVSSNLLVFRPSSSSPNAPWSCLCSNQQTEPLWQRRCANTYIGNHSYRNSSSVEWLSTSHCLCCPFYSLGVSDFCEKFQLRFISSLNRLWCWWHLFWSLKDAINVVIWLMGRGRRLFDPSWCFDFYSSSFW